MGCVFISIYKHKNDLTYLKGQNVNLTPTVGNWYCSPNSKQRRALSPPAPSSLDLKRNFWKMLSNESFKEIFMFTLFSQLYLKQFACPLPSQQHLRVWRHYWSLLVKKTYLLWSKQTQTVCTEVKT